MTRHVLILIAILMMASQNPAVASQPPQLSYQGVVADSEGTPLSGSRDVRFRIYTVASGGTDIWTEIHTINFVDGVFDVVLGNTNSMVALPWGQPMWLETFVEGSDPFSPRTAILPSPYSLRVEELDLSSVGNGQLAADAVTSSKIADGNVVRSLNGLTDQLSLVGGANVSIVASGDSLLVSSTSGGSGSTLDEAYDGAGSGAGRVIVADSGDIDITGGGGLAVIGGGAIGVDTSLPQAPIHIEGGQWNPTTTKGDFMIGNGLFRFGIGMTLLGATAGEARIRSVGGTNRLLFGGGDYDVLTVDPDGISVQRGPFRILDSGRMTLDGDFGTGENNAAIRAENTHSSGTALVAEGTSSAPVVTVRQRGSGDMVAGYDGSTLRFRIEDNGHTVVPSVEVTGGNFQVAANGQVALVGDFGPVETGTALRAENTDAAGIAVWAETQSVAPTVAIDQHGTGELLAGYRAGSPVFYVKNDGQVVTPSVQITGGADIAEPFRVDETEAPVQPGSVLVIDPDNPGELALSREAYDPRVAGIVSGAGGVRPGLTLSQEGVAEGGRHVALTGRAYVRASVENGAIRPGDLMTTSSRPGVAMRATDRERAFGAVLGKAMTGLTDGEGLVLVLVGLQ